MRILFYSNWYVKQTIPVANALARDHDVTVIAPQVAPGVPASDGCVEKSQLIKVLDPRIHLITLPHMQALDLLGIFTVWKVRSLLRRLKPDIVQFNESYDFRGLLLMMLCRRNPYVLTVHDPIPHISEKISLQKFKHWVRDRIRHRACGLIVHGESLKSDLARYSQIPEERIHIVPHGQFGYYAHFDPKESAVQRHGHKNILFFGRWETYKGIETLVEAEPLITQRVPNARIVLAGEGRLPLSAIQPKMVHPEHFEIRNYAIPDEEVPELFLKSEVVALPYFQATQSGPLHIAATFARPVVVTRVGAIPEVVRDGETGILISPGSPEELAEAICRLLENPTEAQRIGENAHTLMVENDSTENISQRQIAVYHRVLEGWKIQRQSRLLRLLQGLVKKVKRDPHYSLDPALRTGDLIALLWKLGISLTRGFWHRLFLGKGLGLCFINEQVKLRNRRHVSLGRNFVAERGCEIQGLARQGLRLGDNVTVGAYAMIRPSGYYGRDIGEGLIVGDRSNIGPFCYLGCYGGITIGQDVMMAPRVSLFAENHDFERTDVPMRQQGVTRKRIVVEDDCWLGSGATILAGVTIGRGSIIAAGAVVNKDVPPYSIVGGNPARILKSRLKIPEPEKVAP